MGRAAKYLTRDERLAARRALRAERDARPGAKELRRKQNRRARRKKTEQQLFSKEAPEVPSAIREQANMVLSAEENLALYKQFCAGRDSIELTGELIVDEDKFEQLIGPGPYPTCITSNPNIPDWPKLHSALHGVMAYKYLDYCDDILLRCQKFPEWHVYSGLYATYHELAIEYNKTSRAAQHHSEQGDQGATAIAVHNGRWISRLMVYTAQDMGYVKEGKGKLVSSVCERRWHVRQSLAL